MEGPTVQRSPSALPHKLTRAGALDVARAHITPLASMLAEQPERAGADGDGVRAGERRGRWTGLTRAPAWCERVAERQNASRMLRAMAQLTRRFHLPSAVRPSSVRIVPDAARALVADGAVLVDVRRQDDHTAQLDGALRITPDAIPEWIAEFRRDVPIVLACT